MMSTQHILQITKIVRQLEMNQVWYLMPLEGNHNLSKSK